MRAIAEWLVNMLGRITRRGRIDPSALRDQMAREDPDLAHVRDVQHDAINALSAKRAADGMAIRHERQFWERASQ